MGLGQGGRGSGRAVTAAVLVAIVLAGVPIATGASAGAQTADTTPPVWSTSAGLITSPLADSLLRLKWQKIAESPGGRTRMIPTYRIYKDGARIGEVSYSPTDLTTYATFDTTMPTSFSTYAVDAVDEAGNVSTTRLSRGQGPVTFALATIGHDGTAAQNQDSNGSSAVPSISADGRFVAFQSTSRNLTADGDPGCPYTPRHVYVRDMQAATTRLADTVLANGCVNATAPRIAAGGGHVAFQYSDSDFSTSQPSMPPGIYLRDLTTDSLSRVDDGARPDPGVGPRISGDGRFVVFRQYNGTQTDLYLRDRQAPTTTSPTRLTTLTGAESVTDYEISADGSTVAWTRLATRQESGTDGAGCGCTRRTITVHTFNLATGETALVETTENDQPYQLESRLRISADGSKLLYYRLTTSANGCVCVPKLVLRDRAANTAQVLTTPASGGDNAWAFELSGDGTRVVCGCSTGVYTPAVVWDLASRASMTLAASFTESNEPPVFAVDHDGSHIVLRTTEPVASPMGTVGPQMVVAAPGALTVVADTAAPSWPGGAVLTATRSGSSATLSWPAATDDTAVTGYRVFRDGTAIADTGATTRTYDVTGLAAGSSTTFAVQAFDAAGNVTASGPSATVVVPSDGPLATLAAAASGGTVALTWPASTLSGRTGYRIHRAVGANALAPLATVGATATTYIDSGVPAESDLRYAVSAILGTSDEPHTSTTSLRTPPVVLSAVESAATLIAPGVARQGSALAVTVRGDRGRAVSVRAAVRSWFVGTTLQAAPVTDERVVNLVETAPGTYTGSLVLDGLAEVSALRATMSDGAGRSATADAGGVPLRVGSALAVRVDAASPSLADGTRLVAFDDVAGAGNQRAITTTGVHRFELSVPGTSYHARLVEPDGRESGAASGLAVRAGLVTDAALTRLPAAALTLRVVAGDIAQRDANLAIADGASGRVLASARTASDGRTAPLRLTAGIPVRISTVQGDPPPFFARRATTDHVPVDGTAELAIPLPTIARGRVVGLVTRRAQPVAGVPVVARQGIGADQYTYATVTGEDGRYDLEAAAGAVTLLIGPPEDARTVTVPTGGSVNVDYEHTGASYHGRIAVFERLSGQAETQVDLGVDAVVQYGVVLETIDSGTVLPYGDVVRFAGRAGQRVRACAEAPSRALPRVCTPVDLTEATDLGTLEVHLEQPVGSAVVSGEVAGAESWTARLVRVTDGAVVPTDASPGTLELASGAPGAHTLVVEAAGARPVRRTLDLPADAAVGTITLAPATTFAGAGNGLGASRGETHVGGTVMLRTSYSAAAAVGDAVVRLALPPGATIVDGGVTRDGVPVTGTALAGAYEVDLGTLAAGGSGVVTHHVRFASDAHGPASFAAVMRFTDGAATEEVLGTATVEVAPVTIEVPSTAPSRIVIASGRAVPGALVSVVSGGFTFASTVASAGGLWHVPVQLAGRAHFVFHAEARSGTRVWRSRPSVVTVDPSVPVLRRARLLVAAHNEPVPYEIDPQLGVARMPIIVNPLQPIGVELDFDRPADIRRGRVRVGEASASLERSGDLLRAEVRPDRRAGEVAIAYKAYPSPMPLDTPRPTERELRSDLPPALADFIVGSTSSSPGSSTASARATVDLPSLGGGQTVDMTLTMTRGRRHTVTAADEEFARLAGAPVYGFAHSFDDSTGRVRLRVSAAIPAELLPLDDTASAVALLGRGLSATRLDAGPRSGSRQARAASVTTEIVDVTLENVFGFGSTMNDVMSALDGGDTYSQLADMADRINSCSALQIQQLTQRLEEAASHAAAGQVAGAMMSVAGVVFGPSTFGVGTVSMWLVSTAVGKAIDWIVARELESIEDDINNAGCPRRRSGSGDDTDEEDLADPTWLYDPSGYVFEAVPSNRVSGVTATVLEGASETGPFVPWDAAAFGQTNPQTTNAEGRYGWDVPEGWWQVAYSKAGYEPAFSSVLRVLPPHFDVNVGMVSLAAPVVAAAAAWVDGSGSGVEVTFDKYMRVGLVTANRIRVRRGDVEVPGVITAVGAENGVDGQPLARTFVFTPAAPLVAGESLSVTTDGLVRSYADRTMVADDVRSLAVADRRPVAPSLGGGGGGFGAGGGGGGGGGLGSTPASVPTTSTTEPVASRSVETTEHRLATAIGEVVVTAPTTADVTLRALRARPDVTGAFELGVGVDVSVTGAPGQAVTVCLPYRRDEVSAAGKAEAALRLLHVNGAAFDDITTHVDRATSRVCGRATSFSPFVVATLDTKRIAGPDRITTAAAVSRQTFAPGVAVAYLASAHTFADALAAGPVAALGAGPVLLTDAADLSPAAREELARLRPRVIVVIGGTAALGSGVARSAGGYAPSVVRIAGADRYATAAAASASAFAPGTAVVYVASGEVFADAISAGSAAAAAKAPVLLTARGALPESARAELVRLRPGRIVLVGGPAAATDSVLGALRLIAPTTRLAGPDRYATSAAVSAATFAAGPRAVWLASGAAFPDALSAVPAAARSAAPVLLTAPASVPPAVATELRRLTGAQHIVVGGQAAVTEAVATSLDRLVTTARAARAARARPGKARAIASTARAARR